MVFRDGLGIYRFINCTAALANETSAVLFAYDANSEDQAAQLEEIYSAWNNHLALNPSTRYLLVARKWDDVQQKKRPIKAGTFFTGPKLHALMKFFSSHQSAVI